MEDTRASATLHTPLLLATQSSGSSLKPSNSNHRAGRYKEKFQALREKYDQVTTTKAEYENALKCAEDKIKRLQEECNLLLDAVDIAVPAQPTLLHYLSRDPIAPPYYSFTVPVPPASADGPPPPIHQAGPPSPPPSGPPHMHVEMHGPPPPYTDTHPPPHAHPHAQLHPQALAPQGHPGPPPPPPSALMIHSAPPMSLHPGTEPTPHLQPIPGFVVEQLGQESSPPATSARGRTRGQSATPRRARGRGGRGRGKKGVSQGGSPNGNGHANGENGTSH